MRVLCATLLVAIACGATPRRDLYGSVSDDPTPSVAAVPIVAMPSMPPEPSWSGFEYPDCEAGRLERMLDQHCSVCHLDRLFLVPIDCMGSDCNPRPVFFSVLIAADLVVPGDAEGSQLLRRLRDASMPPPSVGLEPLSRDQVEQLARFIDALDPATSEPGCEPEIPPDGL